jgi:RNA polymerase-binding transcription factor DksA
MRGMHIENSEIETWMPDWSPNITKPVGSFESAGVDSFPLSQRAVLLELRQEISDAMAEVATASRSNNGEERSLKTHPADAGSDTYDREFALSILSHEQNALYEIDQALRRIELGTYGICEISGRPIPRARLEAIPFARFTVEVQTNIERRKKALLLAQPNRLPFPAIESEEERLDYDRTRSTIDFVDQ